MRTTNFSTEAVETLDDGDYTTASAQRKVTHDSPSAGSLFLRLGAVGERAAAASGGGDGGEQSLFVVCLQFLASSAPSITRSTPFCAQAMTRAKA